MGVGMGLAPGWMPTLDRGGFSPTPLSCVMGVSLVFICLTWNIPSFAGSMMAGAVSLSLADAVYPAILGSRAAGAGVATAAAVGAGAIAAGRGGLGPPRVRPALPFPPRERTPGPSSRAHPRAATPPHPQPHS